MSSPYSEALGSTLIDRTIREKIVLVGVTLPGSTDDDTEASLDELDEDEESTEGEENLAELTKQTVTNQVHELVKGIFER